MITSRASKLIAVAIAGASVLGLASCSSDGKSSSAQAAGATTTAAPAATTVAPATVAPQPAATTAAPSPTTAAPAETAGADTTPPAQAGGKVNINDASISDLEDAFKAAKVPSARRWAQEVDEYRPYPVDPNFAKLRQELGKYNIDPQVLELIISLLEY